MEDDKKGSYYVAVFCLKGKGGDTSLVESDFSFFLS